MARVSLFGFLVAFSFIGGACSGSSSSGTTSLTVTDTLGIVFSGSCANGFCTLTPSDPNLKPLSCESEYGATDVFTLVWGWQILRVNVIQVPTSGYLSFNPDEPAHPVQCQTDADCAPNLISPAYTCQNGLCQYLSASTPTQTLDVIALCQADIPWPASCPYLTNPLFAQRMSEVAAVCGPATNCSNVPADCRQAAPAPAGLDASAAPASSPVDGGAGAADGGT